jgi:hypothetical protein
MAAAVAVAAVAEAVAAVEDAEGAEAEGLIAAIRIMILQEIAKDRMSIGELGF